MSEDVKNSKFEGIENQPISQFHFRLIAKNIVSEINNTVRFHWKTSMSGQEVNQEVNEMSVTSIKAIPWELLLRKKGWFFRANIPAPANLYQEILLENSILSRFLAFLRLG